MIMALILTLASDTPASCCDGMKDFLSDPAFIRTHLPPRPINFIAQSGKNVTFPDANGRPAHAFYVPPRKGAKAAVVMVHEWWGLNDHIRKEAERLHNDTGYAVLAVDLFDGKVATTPEDAGKLMAGVNVPNATAIVRGAVVDLKNGKFGFKAPKIGTIGYCFGGGWSLNTAIEGGKNVNACVMYYGMPDNRPARIAMLKAPVLFIYGTQDKWITPAVAETFHQAMEKAGKSDTVRPYNADHAFANPSNPKYDKVSGEKARHETLAFYKKHLG